MTAFINQNDTSLIIVITFNDFKGSVKFMQGNCHTVIVYVGWFIKQFLLKIEIMEYYMEELNVIIILCLC